MYDTYVLDSWVRKYIETARAGFEKIETVADRKIYVNLPVDLTPAGIRESKCVEALTTANLRDMTAGTMFRLLITGEGGAEKTTLSCRVARWAMPDKGEEHLLPHRVIAVLI